jgi:Tfp pilus assembly protein PilP
MRRRVVGRVAPFPTVFPYSRTFTVNQHRDPYKETHKQQDTDKLDIESQQAKGTGLE